MSLLERARPADAVELTIGRGAERETASYGWRDRTTPTLRHLVRCESGVRRSAADHGSRARLALSLELGVKSRAGVLRLKRAVDICAAVVGLVVLSPLLAVVAIAIRWSTPGPALFKQKRHGVGGVPFDVYKFRTFHADQSDPGGRMQTVANDRRVTPLGRILRKTNVDELPQLINVLLGEMSIVGPRPHPIGMLAAGVPYEELIPVYQLRHLVMPGITGLAQVRGFRGPTAERLAARGRVLNDLVYVQKMGLLLDLKIVCATVLQELRRGSGM